MGALHLFNLGHFQQKYKIEYFVETGLGSGGGLSFAAHFGFNRLFSTEIDELAIQRFNNQLLPRLPQNNRIQLLLGKSEECLEKVLPSLNRNVLFWLDAHFPGETSGKNHDYEKDLEIRLPLEKELEVINKYRRGYSDVLIIDDARIYENNDYEEKNLDEMGHADLFKPNNNLNLLLSRWKTFRFPIDTGYIICLPR